MFAKYVGLTAEAAQAIEAKRKNIAESESDIIVRELGIGLVQEVGDPTARPAKLDVGQGIALAIGETIHLFLSKTDALSGRPVGSATVTPDGLLVEGVLFGKDRGSYVQKPMQFYQQRHSHLGADGKLVPLSAYRQWYAYRDGKLLPLEALKDPSKTRRRRTSVQMNDRLSKLSATELLKELGL
ncbi:hypothetical protein [uncultured Brevundimonas sp.]|uniref:hypothetical protein n=1 Tax=uncultured Brevundimonas sp. TaxID=213418 RepID=UPI00260F58D8|nr:hypothetical protein [uncultured Brevundimonas sp.]